MKKKLFALALIPVLAAVLIACGDTDTTDYVEPVMEGTTVTEAASEFSSEAEPQIVESESTVQKDAASSFSAGKTTVATTAAASKAPAATQAVSLSVGSTNATTVAKSADVTATTTQRAATTTRSTTQRTTSTTRYIPPTTTTTRPTTTTTIMTQAKPDYESMGQATYQTKVIEALNNLRKGRSLAPMAPSNELMASTLAQAQKMAAAGKSFHTEGFPPGFESVAHVPYNFPAQVLGEMLTNHVQNFLMTGYSNVGIAVVRSGNTLYAVMQGN